MNKKILVLAESLRINETSSGIVSSTFIKSLQDLGHKVTVIYPHEMNYEVTWLDGCKLIKLIKHDVKPQLINKIPKVRALPSYFRFSFSTEFKSLVNSWSDAVIRETTNDDYDAIFVLGSGTSFSPHFAIPYFKKTVELPVFAYIHDPFPIHIYPKPYKRTVTLLTWMQAQRFKKVLSFCSGVLFPSKKLLEWMSGFYPIIPEKCYVVPHLSVQLSNLPSLQDDNKIQLDSKSINIIHAGTLLGPRNPKFLLNAVNRLFFEHPELTKDVKLTFIGKLAREHKSLAAISSKNVSLFDRRVSYKKSLELISQADAILVIEAISDYSPFMPGKLADIFLKNKPIIVLGPKNSEVMRIIGDTRYYAPLDDEDMIHNVLKNFIQDKKANNAENKSSTCKLYTSNYGLAKLKEIIDSQV